MIVRELDYFSIAQICNSGQCFRMRQLDENRYSVAAADRYLEVVQEGKRVFFDCPEEEFEGFWRQYFDLDTDYGKYIRKIDSKDHYLAAAAEMGSGIRILRQELWEIIISFLISQQNNIVRIRRCVDNICRNYGDEKIAGNGTRYYTFPAAGALAMASEEELRACNLGYRAKYVLQTAERVASGEVSLERIKQMKYGEARQELLKLYGVGDKVADCICLFALHELEAFPIDTHIRQALDAHYKKGFPMGRYRGCEGIMQQYIFYYESQSR